MVHVRFDPTSVSLKDFEPLQIGMGEYSVFYGARPYQRGFGYYQRGAGISDFFRTLWRAMLPLVKSAGKAMGQEALSTGSRILEKVATGENVKDTITDQAIKGVENLVEKAKHRQAGGGIKGDRNFNQLISAKSHIPFKRGLIGKRVKISSSGKKRKRSDAFGFY